MASLAQLSTSLWRSSVKVPFLWWGADMLGGRHWEPPWLWPKPPEPLSALVLLVPADGGEEEEEKSKECEILLKLEDGNSCYLSDWECICCLDRAVTWWQRLVGACRHGHRIILLRCNDGNNDGRQEYEKTMILEQHFKTLTVNCTTNLLFWFIFLTIRWHSSAVTAAFSNPETQDPQSKLPENKAHT